MSLYIRGDFFVCPNPLSLDPYTICEHNCSFCFTKQLEQTLLKRKAQKGLKPYDTKALERTLKIAFSRTDYESPVIGALRAGLPVLVGRKCEPLCKSEREYRATLRVLRLLADFDVPTVVETKGFIPSDEYFKVLGEMNAGVNVTLTPGPDELAKRFHEPTTYSERWGLISELRASGIWVGITGEPIIHGFNDKPEYIRAWLDKARELKVTHVNFGDFRVSNTKIAAEMLKSSGVWLTDIIEAKAKTWLEVGRFIFEEAHKRNLICVTPDWVNFWSLNDSESCCGFLGFRFKFHLCTFQHALALIKRNRRVKLNEVLSHNIYGEKYAEKFRELWKGKPGYFSLADAQNVRKIGVDGEGFPIYGYPKTLEGAFK